jgi:hypothetical protein
MLYVDRLGTLLQIIDIQIVKSISTAGNFEVVLVSSSFNVNRTTYVRTLQKEHTDTAEDKGDNYINNNTSGNYVLVAYNCMQ